jgi:DegV family protein with EDD domain
LSKIAIVTDSTGYIPPDLVREYDIKVAPQVLVWGDETLRDGVDITPDEFYARLKTASVMPTTSQATIAEFREIFEPLVAGGCSILAVLISAKLSGTIQSAEQAKTFYPGATIEIVDSESTAMAMGFQVLAAARAAAAGRSFQEVVAVARECRTRTGVVLVVDTLEFLHRGGRIGGAARLLGTALNLKPVLELTEGRLEPLEKVRTKGKAVARILEILAPRLEGQTMVRLSTVHAAAPDEARALLDAATARFHPIETMMADASPVVGNHAGPGTVGLAYSFGI